MTKAERKKLITQKVLEIIRPDYTPDQLKKVSKIWWQNPKLDSGLRLSDTGFQAFKLAEIESYEYTIEGYVIGNWLLQLDRHIDCPYALVHDRKILRLYVYDSRIAVMINLYQGINHYLNSFKKISD
jgi:hypothetical protein